MPEIVIKTDLDFTPKGKRSARVVTTSRGGRQIRLYVGGKIYRKCGRVTEEVLKNINAWLLVK